MNEISSSALLDIQLTLLCVCVVDSCIPESEHFVERRFHGLFSNKKDLTFMGFVGWGFVFEMRSTSSAEQKFPDEIT